MEKAVEKNKTHVWRFLKYDGEEASWMEIFGSSVHIQKFCCAGHSEDPSLTWR